MTSYTERRIGPLLLQALHLACEQRDLDIARGIEQVIRMVDGRAGASNAERRQTWQDDVAAVRAELRNLESAIRRRSPAPRRIAGSLSAQPSSL